MKTITINRKQIKITPSNERGLRALKAYGFVCLTGDMWEGAPKWRTNMLPKEPEALAELGIKIKSVKAPLSARERDFFREHPRAQHFVSGEKRRINIIIDKLNQEI